MVNYLLFKYAIITELIVVWLLSKYLEKYIKISLKPSIVEIQPPNGVGIKRISQFQMDRK